MSFSKYFTGETAPQTKNEHLFVNYRKKWPG